MTSLLPKSAMLLTVAVGLVGCRTRPPERPIVVTYWCSWTGFEAQAMQKVVDEFNRSQSDELVQMVTGGDPENKVVLAAAGGNPPDIVALSEDTIAPLADKGVLAPLDEWMKKDGVSGDRYVAAYFDICCHRGQVWGLPLTPYVAGLFWNKDLFAAAGLDPECPPETMEELDSFNQKLTQRDPRGRLQQVGFLPNEPDMLELTAGYFFGGEPWDGDSRITMNSAENLRAYTWFQSFAQYYGAQDVQNFRSGFGSRGSPQNAFFMGKVAMELDGDWMYNIIHRFRPDMHWGAAAFPHPQDRPDLQDTTVVGIDALAICHGAPHPQEAWAFLRYMAQAEPLEELCLGQAKQSPLKIQSAHFLSAHPNPTLALFSRLAKGRNAHHVPGTAVWGELKDELHAASERLTLMQESPAQALDDVQNTMQRQLDRERRRWQRLGSR